VYTHTHTRTHIPYVSHTKKEIVFPYRTHWLLFLVEEQYVLCEVRDESFI